MSKSSVVRASLLGSAAVLALLGASSISQAVETQFGDVQIIFDTTVSVGASVRTTSRETQFLSESNGGPVDPRGGVADSLVVITEPGVAFAGGGTGSHRWTNNL